MCDTTVSAEVVESDAAKIQRLMAERDEAVRISESYKTAYQNAQNDCSTIAFVLSRYVDDYGVDDIHDYINESGRDNTEVELVLVSYDAIDSSAFCREYAVTVTIPVTITVEVQARTEDDAEDAARDLIDVQGIEDYHMDYNTYYDLEFVEVREI